MDRRRFLKSIAVTRLVTGSSWSAAAVTAEVAESSIAPGYRVAAAEQASSERSFRVPLRTEVQASKGSGIWQKAYFEHPVGQLAHQMEPVLQVARSAGILIIHAPSETMDFYKDYPQRRLMLALPPAIPPPSLGIASPALPIDDSDEGCYTAGDTVHKAWTRENPALSIAPNDVISDDGMEIHRLLQQKSIKFFMGVHVNMCVLNRPFAIKQMTNWGKSCVLVRDLTDAMYNPQARPYVPHPVGTEHVIEYVEKYWCPTTLSADLVNALT
jgi:hypothetical protein